MQPLARPSSPEEAEEVRSSASTSPPARGGRRRRAASEGALPLPRPLASSSSSERFDLGRRSPSFRRDVGHAAAETFLLTRLTLILLRYLGLGYRWITKFLALVCYAMFLMPGLLQGTIWLTWLITSMVIAVKSIMEGEQSLKRFSSEVVLRDLKYRHAVSLLPRIILLHGTSDTSIPSNTSKSFADALRSAGVQVELVLYKGKTHTDLFLQDPLRGGKDELLEKVISVIHAGDEVALAKDAVAPPARRLLPEFVLQLACKMSPF